MASITAQQSTSNPLTIDWSWTAESNTWWNVDVDGTQVDSGSGNTSGTGSYTVSAYGQHTVALYVRFTGGGDAYPSTTVTLIEPQPPQPSTVTCNKFIYYNGVYDSAQTEGGLTPGYSFTPSLHQPTVGAQYSLDYIIYNNTDVTSVAITCPSNNFQVDYYYITSSSKVYIYATKMVDGVATPSWWPATPYIYTSSGWQEATPYIYTSSGWQ